MRLLTAVSAAIVLLIANVCVAQDELEIGAAAPGLDIEEWIQGSETTISSGKVYVVLFWDASLMRNKDDVASLNELSKEFADDGLTVIGVTSDDKARMALRSMGEKMTFVVARDRRDSTKRAWMDAAGKKNLPVAFIVDRHGKIVFIGSPLLADEDNFEDILRKVMAGRFDPKLEAQAEPVLRAARQARKMKNWRLATSHYNEVIALDPKVFASAAVERFDMMLRDMGDKTEAYAYANSLMTGVFSTDAGALRMLASKIATDAQIDSANRDLSMALTVAEKALEVSGPKDAASLATLAQVYFTRGDTAKAIDLQKQAYFNANPKHKANYKRTLTMYQEAAQRAISATTKPS